MCNCRSKVVCIRLQYDNSKQKHEIGKNDFIKYVRCQLVLTFLVDIFCGYLFLPLGSSESCIAVQKKYISQKLKYIIYFTHRIKLNCLSNIRRIKIDIVKRPSHSRKVTTTLLLSLLSVSHIHVLYILHTKHL